ADPNSLEPISFADTGLRFTPRLAEQSRRVRVHGGAPLWYCTRLVLSSQTLNGLLDFQVVSSTLRSVTELEKEADITGDSSTSVNSIYSLSWRSHSEDRPGWLVLGSAP